MAIITYPLNGITYDADDAQTYLCTRTSGVFDSDDCFAITVTDDMTVTISPGLAWIKNADYAGKSVCVTESVDLTVSIGTTLPRIDRVVLRFSKADNASELAILKGTASNDCVAPSLTQTETVFELGLYEIYVAASATSISEDVITDTRNDDTVCGVMKDAVTSSSDYSIGSAGSTTIPIYANTGVVYNCFSNSIMALGVNACANGANAASYGYNATASTNAVAVGGNVSASSKAVAIGKNASSVANSITIGYNAKSTSSSGIAIGTDSSTTAISSVAIGTSVDSNGAYGIVIGVGSCVESSHGIAMGQVADAIGNNAIAIGSSAEARVNSISIGVDTNTYAQSVAIGHDAVASGSSSIAIGYGANTSSTFSVVLGYDAIVSATNSISIGYGANTSAVNSISIGHGANTSGANSIAIGGNAIATHLNSAAIGHSANASGYDCIAFGASASATANYCIVIGYNSNATRINAVAIGRHTQANGLDGVALGTNARANANYCTAVGINAHAIDLNAVAVGHTAVANGYNCIALGTNARATNDQSTAVGVNAHATELNAVAVGHTAVANLEDSCAFGSNARATGSHCTAIGFNAHATANYATTLGRGSSCANANGIQLGHSSYTSSLTCKVSLTTTSDIRDKTDIEEIGDGATEFIKSLKAIRFVFNQRENYIDEENLADEDREKLEKYGMCAYDTEAYEAGTKKGTRIRGGVSAQEVQTALESIYGDSSYTDLVNDNLYDFDADEIPDDVESKLAVNYTGFIPYLIKAIQEIDARVSCLEGADTASEEDDTSQA